MIRRDHLHDVDPLSCRTTVADGDNPLRCHWLTPISRYHLPRMAGREVHREVLEIIGQMRLLDDAA
ncbi:hypothetical protein [Mycolicibacterium sp.]|jgi:hypothetical protein|uniref:hypothetical protein n=1 Tax=Mycolicibacterium sp. TaxID=2320850 RepID=UPI001A2AAA33|nr:hypothetical protein [Mycolicibacterium sp.]MBJ7399986.1 hypothetical protein [Mycolicibacterium sp.]